MIHRPRRFSMREGYRGVFFVTMIIGTSVDSSVHLAHELQRQREIDGASRRLSRGSRVDRMANDGGAFQFSSRLNGEIRTNRAAANNLHNAITFVQTQSDGLRTADRMLNRMSEIALRASDPTLTSRDRLRYQSEFSGLQTQLSFLAVEKFNEDSLFDPQASKYADVYPVSGVSDGGWEMDEQVVDIGALSGGIRLWWNPTWQTDRIKIYQGSSVLFDSGEYRSQHWLNFPNYEGNPDPTYDKVSEMKGESDSFQIDFSPGSVQVTADPSNVGVSLHDKDALAKFRAATSVDEWNAYGGDAGVNALISRYVTSEDYPKSEAPTGDSTKLRFVVNEDPGGFPNVRQPHSTTVWSYGAEITKESLSSKSVLAGADGSTFEIQNVGFSTLSELSVDTLQGALTALDAISLEQDNVRYQQGVIGSEIATYRSQVGVLDNKTLSESRAMSKIVSADVAEETTRLAKNLLLRDASSSILAQARVNAANVYKSLL